MPTLPLTPPFKRYRGTKPEKHRKLAEERAIAQRICEHMNTLIANNPAEIQQYAFGFIAADLRVSKQEVWEAISSGGSNGITLRVTEQDREALAPYKRRS